MEIRKISNTGLDTAKRRSLPVPISNPQKSETPQAAQFMEASDFGRPRRSSHRPAAAFLAQLAVQYDDIDQARRTRKSLRKTALATYANGRPNTQGQPRSGQNCRLKV